MNQDAYSYAEQTTEEGQSLHVMISAERSVQALRDLADRIERKEVFLDKVRVFTFADSQEYTKTALKLVFIEKR
jgi:hypothetical protein